MSLNLINKIHGKRTSKIIIADRHLSVYNNHKGLLGGIDVNTLSQLFQFKEPSPILHPQTIYYHHINNVTNVVIEQPPSYITMHFGIGYPLPSEINTCKCYLPYLYYMLSASKPDKYIVRQESITWADKPITNINQKMYVCGLGNIYTRSLIGWYTLKFNKSYDINPSFIARKQLSRYLNTVCTVGGDDYCYGHDKKRDLKTWPQKNLSKPNSYLECLETQDCFSIKDFFGA